MIIGVELRYDLPLPSVRIFSDEATSENAMREIEPWALANQYVAFSPLPLGTAERDGADHYFSVACSDRAIAAAGHRIYADQIREIVEAENVSGTVAIDILSNAYALAGCQEDAMSKLRKTHPLAVIALLIVGFRTPSRASASAKGRR